MSTFPDSNSATAVLGSGMMRATSVSCSGLAPQYALLRTKRTKSSCFHSTSFHAPVPIGLSPKSAATVAGTIDATGIASSFGKIANGSVSVMTTVLSFSIFRPLMDEALPAAKSVAP